MKSKDDLTLALRRVTFLFKAISEELPETNADLFLCKCRDTLTNQRLHFVDKECSLFRTMSRLIMAFTLLQSVRNFRKTQTPLTLCQHVLLCKLKQFCKENDASVYVEAFELLLEFFREGCLTRDDSCRLCRFRFNPYTPSPEVMAILDFGIPDEAKPTGMLWEVDKDWQDILAGN